MEITCYAVLRDAQLLLFTAALSSASQLRYVHVDADYKADGKIAAQAAACRKWVESFAKKCRAKGEALSGQVCWDFMV